MAFLLAPTIYIGIGYFGAWTIANSITETKTHRRTINLLMDFPSSPNESDLQRFCQEAADIEEAKYRPFRYCWSLISGKPLTNGYPFMDRRTWRDGLDDKTWREVDRVNISRWRNVPGVDDYLERKFPSQPQTTN